MGSLGPLEIALIIGGVVLLFGAKKIPEVMKGVGNGIKEFKTAMSSDDEKISDDEKKQEKIKN